MASVQSHPASDHEDSENNANEVNDASRKLQRPIVRGAQACTQCRSHKIKCQPAIDNTPFPCQRCRNQGLNCEVLRHNRGRKRKNLPGQEAQPSVQQATVYYPDGSSTIETCEPPEKQARSASSDSFNRSISYPAPLPLHLPGNGGSGGDSHAFDTSNSNAMHLLEEAIAMHHNDPQEPNTPSSGGMLGHSPGGFSMPPHPPYSPAREAAAAAAAAAAHDAFNMHPHHYGTPTAPHMPHQPPFPPSASTSSMPVPLLPHPSMPTRVSPVASSSSFILPTLATPRLHQIKREEEDDSTNESNKLEGMKFPFLIPRAERPGRKGMFSLTSLMNSEDVEEVGPGPGLTSQSEYALLANDPIKAGVISIEDANTLFNLYIEEMNPTTSVLDPTIHTHDFVRSRSSFLYIAILSVVSRYLNSTSYAPDGTRKRLISPVYTYCKMAARAHLKAVLGDVVCTLEVVQGLCVLTYFKEPEDEKACLHLYRAIAIARECGIDVPTPRGKAPPTEEEALWIRVRQRVWLSLFIANTVLTMQFDMKTLIGPDDPLISTSARWAVGSHLPIDTLLVANVQLRRLYHTYSDLARAQEYDSDTPAERASRLVSLSVLTKTANRDLEQAAKDWAEEMKTSGLPGRLESKVKVWLSAIKLKLNLTIIQLVLPGLKERASMIDNFLPSSKSTGGTNRMSDLGCIAAFHHSINSACYILQSMTIMEEKRLLSFGTDTFLHFAIYSAFFLWTLCRDAGPGLLDVGEVEHCYTLIAGAARSLEMASIYPGDSPALHGRFLRNLVNTRSRASNSRTDDPSSNPSMPTGQTENQVQPGPLSILSLIDNTGPGSIPNNSANDPNLNQQPPTSAPFANYANNINQSSHLSGSQQAQGSQSLPQAAWGTGDFDAMLTADWGAMQKDFPWAFNDFSMPFLDSSVNGSAGVGIVPNPTTPTQILVHSLDVRHLTHPANVVNTATQADWP